MKLLISMILFLTMGMALADEVKIDLSPTKPVAGEVFQVFFRIFTDADEEPHINFSPGGLEVVGKANQGISTRTVYANGKLTVSREVTVVYDMVAAKPGTSFMRDIKIDMGSKSIKHPVIAITVIKEPEVMPDVFVMSDVPKKSLYVGEGVIVRYFIYSKVPVNNVDIKKYPKLNSFLKRFLQEAERSERVSVDGQIYLRTQIYAAKLFPEKAGELKIDPMGLTVTYPHIRPGDPFGAFGMGRDYKTKTISSEMVKIQVSPLPQPVPSNFSGLVGQHEIQLQFGQTKLIVNEPLEVKLTVSGGGALENLEAPKLLDNPALEEFETNGDLKISNADQATKTFDYTFLPKNNLKLPASTLTLSYFDPEHEKYSSIELQIPEIEVAGGGKVAAAKPEDKKPQVEKPSASKPFNVEMPKVENFAEPIVSTGRNYKYWLPYFNAGLAALSILIAFGWVIRKEGLPSLKSKSNIPSQFKKGHFSLGEFTKWLSPLIQKTGKSPSAIIQDSELEEETKTYFIDLLKSNDYKDYSSRKSELVFSYHPAHFKRLGRYIESAKDEDTSQPA